MNQSITDISLVGAMSHEGVNRRRQWMAVSGMTCRRSWRGVFSEQFWKCPRCQNGRWKQVNCSR